MRMNRFSTGKLTAVFREKRTLLKRLLFYFFSFIFAMVLTLGLSFMLITGNIMKEQIDKSNSEYLRQILYGLDDAFANIDTLMVNFGTHGLVNTTINSPKAPVAKFAEYIDMMDMMRTIKNTNRYVDSIYLYIEGDGKLLTSDHSIYKADEFYDLSWMADYKVKRNFFMDTHSVFSNAVNRNIEAISIIKSLPLAVSNRKQGALIVNISEQMLNASINADRVRKTEEIWMIDKEGRIISGKNKEWLYQSFPWSKSVVAGTAANGSIIAPVGGVKSMITYQSSGKYDWTIVSTIPYRDLFQDYSRLRNIIIAINIAGLLIFLPAAGLLSRRLYHPISKLVDLLMQQGSDKEALLKDDLLFIKESISHIVSAKDSAYDLLARIKPIAKDKFTKDLLLGRYEDNQMVQDGLQMIGLQFQWEHFIAIVIEADRPNQRRRSANDTESASSTADLQEKLESCFEEQGYVYAIHEVEPGRLGAIINFTAEAQKDVDNIYYMCLALKERIGKESGYTITIGIGRPADDALQIKNSYREAVKALQQKLVFGKNNVISIYDADKSTDEASGLTKDYIDYIIKHLKSSNMSLCIGKTNEAIDLLVAGKTDSGKLYKFFYSLVNLITFTVSEMGCSTEAVFGSDIDPVDDFLKNEDIVDIKVWFSTVFGRIGEVMEQKNNKIPHDLIEKVKEYAYKHYSANISIGDVAEKVYLHPHYLGKLFKKVEGITWNEYLNQVRMDKAKELLLQTTMKVSDISIAVGVGSPQYFIYCFKNAYGITPKKMRESRFIQGTDETDA